jgi:chemotaxis protein MotC
MVAIFLIFGASAPVLAADEGTAPYEVVRELRIFQDRAVLRARETPAQQRKEFEKIGTKLAKFDPGVWTEPKNARAIVIFVLSGGDPHLLRKLIDKGVAFGIDKQLVLAALAYAERRDDDAIKLLEGMDLNSLDKSIAGHIALVHALLIEKKDPPKSLALLDMARILSSGTVVEEAALRRQTIMEAKAQKFDAFETLASQYFRRFPKSIFASSFRRQFAEEVVAPLYGSDAKRLSRLESMFRGLGESDRHKVCLLIAEEGIAKGNVAMVRFAAESAALKSASPDALRIQLYAAAALVVTEKSEEGLVMLRTINRSMLGARDQAVLDAALAVVREVRRPPRPVSSADAEPEAEAKASPEGGPSGPPASSRLARAEEMLAGVDKLLKETGR